MAVGIALLVTGTLLLLTAIMKPTEKDYSGISWYKGFLVGLMQALSITPGISRSGSTIAVGMFLGIDRSTAANFSFLMAVPAILGAMVVEIKELGEVSQLGFFNALGGFISAFLFGFLALKVLLGVVRKGKLHLFSFYCFALGIFTILYFLPK